MEPRTPWLPAPPLPEPTPPVAFEPFRAPEPPADPRRPSWFKRRLGPILAALVALLAKLKTLILLLPKLKLLTTFGTMFVSVAAYSLLWGWQFAAGFVVLLLVHEMGHVIALRREGIKASAPMFIPFLGAVISARSLGDDATAEARVGLAGPVLGTIGVGGVHPHLARSPATTCGARSPTPGSCSTCSTCCPSCRSTAAARWRRWRRGCGSSGSCR